MINQKLIEGTEIVINIPFHYIAGEVGYYSEKRMDDTDAMVAELKAEIDTVGLDPNFPMEIELSSSFTKEVALVTSILQHNEIIHQSLMQSFDTLYEMAKEFVSINPPGKTWEHEDFEEAVVKFGREKTKLPKS